MKFNYAQASLCAVLLLAGCLQPEQTPKATRTTGPPVLERSVAIKPEELASLKDAVCKMAVTPDHTYLATFEGKKYGFCSTYCRDEFNKKPAHFLTVLDANPPKEENTP